MEKGLVVADSKPIFSLVCLDKLDILQELFGDLYTTPKVWDEIIADSTRPGYQKMRTFFSDRVRQISEASKLNAVMVEGESEAMILYKELQADFLLIEDEKKRIIPKHSNVNYIGVIGILSVAKDLGMITKLKPLFETLLQNNLFHSVRTLNEILVTQKEGKIDLSDYPGHEEVSSRGKNVLF